MEANVEALVLDNLKLVGLAMKAFKDYRGYEYEDIRQIGYIGLIKAAEKFKPELGFTFSTYAIPKIKGEIMRHFRDNRPIKISRRLKDIYFKYCSFENQNLTEDEICEKLGVSRELLNDAITAMQPLHSFEEQVSQDGRITFEDILDSQGNLEDKIIQKIEFEDKFKILKKFLSEKELKVLELRLRNKSQGEIAKAVNCSQAQVSRYLLKIKNLIQNVCNYYDGKTEHLRLRNNPEPQIKNYENKECRDMYEEHVKALKSWLLENPGKPLFVNEVLRNAGLEIKNGYQSHWKNRAIKELQKEGYIINLTDGYVIVDDSLIKEPSKSAIERLERVCEQPQILPSISVSPQVPPEPSTLPEQIDSSVALMPTAWETKDKVRFELKGNLLTARDKNTSVVCLEVKIERLERLIAELSDINKVINQIA